MNQTYQYPKAPIAEASMDIIFEESQNLQIKEIEALADDQATSYPNKQPIFDNLFQLYSIASSEAKTTNKQSGFRLIDSYHKQFVQFQSNRFTFNRLNPYPGWHIFQPEAKRLWELYCKTIKPGQIQRISLRYINRIDLPAPVKNFSRYLTTLPSFNPKISKELNKFFMHLEIPQEDIQANLLLSEALVNNPPKDKASVLLDIDLIKENEFTDNDNDLWELFEKFHERKNQIFEACITDEVRRLIDSD